MIITLPCILTEHLQNNHNDYCSFFCFNSSSNPTSNHQLDTQQSLVISSSSIPTSEPRFAEQTFVDKLDDKLDTIIDKFLSPYAGAFNEKENPFETNYYYYLPPQNQPNHYYR